MSKEKKCEIFIKQKLVEAWIDEVEKDIKEQVITDNLVACLKEMLGYIKRLEERIIELAKKVEDLEDRIWEIEEEDIIWELIEEEEKNEREK